MTILSALPASYAEAAKVMTEKFLCPDGVERKAQGCGSSGVEGKPGFVYSMHFADGAIWSSDARGFKTADGFKRDMWDRELAKLAKVDLDLISATFGDIAARWTVKTKAPAKLVIAAKIKAIQEGKIEAETCSRCGGSGHYSFNQISGTRCFGCSGSGKKYPSSRDALRAIRCA